MSPSRPARHPAWGIALVALIALAGLFYVKWSPYYDRAFTAAQTHSIGASILTGGQDAPPAPSLHAALDYAKAYGLAIWKALLLGLLLGSAIQTLLPPRWIERWLGRPDAGGVVTGGLLSIPSMMCTCCAAPVIAGLRHCRAAPGNTAAYWLGNTMLNPATLVFMGFVLGWHWAGLRLALGLAMVLGLGWALNRMSRADCAPVDDSAPAAFDTDPAYFQPGCCWAPPAPGCSPCWTSASTTACCGSWAPRWSALCSSSRPRAKSPSSRPCWRWALGWGRRPRCW